MATAQLAMGRSPLDVQRQMGHTTLQMTNKYASLTIGHLKKLHERQGIRLYVLIQAALPRCLGLVIGMSNGIGMQFKVWYL